MKIIVSFKDLNEVNSFSDGIAQPVYIFDSWKEYETFLSLRAMEAGTSVEMYRKRNTVFTLPYSNRIPTVRMEIQTSEIRVA